MQQSQSKNILVGVVVALAVLLASLNLIACVAGVWVASQVSGALSQEVVPGPSVGILRAEGAIISGRPPSLRQEGIVYSEQMAKILKRVKTEDNIKALVLRVDSPGGSVVGSNEIYEALLQIDKPIVVSMGEMAASGGYYISCAADRIMVNPGTLTGSIGVIAQMPNVQGLMEKLGVEVNVIKSGKLKDEGSPFRPMTEEEKAIWQTIIDESYAQFVSIVATGRNLPEDKVRQIADGRVYTGLQAVELGLADETGNLADAIKLAGEMGGIAGEPKTIELYKPPSLLESLLISMPSSSTSLADLKETAGFNDYPVLQYLYVGP